MNQFRATVCLLVLLTATGYCQNPLSRSGHRVALLIGNQTYQKTSLPCVAPSLEAVHGTLQRHGFVVTSHTDLNQHQAKQVIETFVASIPTNGVAVVYYCGLGAHVERLGKSYNLLRPVHETIESDNDYRSRGINVNELAAKLTEESGARQTILILDACFESPLVPKKGNVAGGMRVVALPETISAIYGAGTKEVRPAPDGPTWLALSLAKRMGEFDLSVKGALSAIAADGEGNPWFLAATESGLGTAGQPPVNSLTEQAPGNGWVNSAGMGFRWCPAGAFTMGSEAADTPQTRDRTPANVTLSAGFWMGEHEVTQREYRLIMKKNVPTGFTTHRNAPFWGVSEAKTVTDFCNRLTAMDRQAGRLPDGWSYRCPTEAEWEYACRAGSERRWCFGDSPANLARYANFGDRSLWMENANYYWGKDQSSDGVAQALAPVGSYAPNAWGIRDMHGNVAELVADHHQHELPGGKDPLVRVKKDGRSVIRGGAWCSLPEYCESSFRNTLSGRDKLNYVGFRIILAEDR